MAAAISAPIAAGVFGGVTGAGTDALVALFRTLGLNVFQSAFAQGLTSDPLDKTISYTIVFVILSALPITVRTMYSRGEATVARMTAARRADVRRMSATTGYFVAGESWLHRRNPLTKLLALGFVLLAAFLLPPSSCRSSRGDRVLAAWSAGLLRPSSSARCGSRPSCSPRSSSSTRLFFPGAKDVLVPLGPLRGQP